MAEKVNPVGNSKRRGQECQCLFLLSDARDDAMCVLRKSRKRSQQTVEAFLRGESGNGTDDKRVHRNSKLATKSSLWRTSLRLDDAVMDHSNVSWIEPIDA